METPIFECDVVDNDTVAVENRRLLRKSGVFVINLIGGPGVGKTTLVETTAARLGPHVRVGAIVANAAPARDAQRLTERVEQVVQVSTTSLDAMQLAAALRQMNLSELDVLMIESATGSAVEAELDMGQDVRVGVLSVSGGDDKAAQSPAMVRHADAVLLTKLDLRPYIPFDADAFRADVHAINPSAELIELSSLHEECAEHCVDRWVEWLHERWQKALNAGNKACDSATSDMYMG